MEQKLLLREVQKMTKAIFLYSGLGSNATPEVIVTGGLSDLFPPGDITAGVFNATLFVMLD